MALLSNDTVQRLCIGLSKQDSGNELASAVNNGATAVGQTGLTLAKLIVATNVSTTIDFGSLLVGDKVVHISVAGGTNDLATVVTAATLPEAAVVSDLYLVFRPLTLPAASNFQF